jgi:calcineurin-like phosphoesterase family protein
MKRVLWLIAAAVFAWSCGSSSPTGPREPPPGGGGLGGAPAVLVGAGDIADCATPGSSATATLLDGISGTIFTAGDHAYPAGSEDNFRQCYDPTWGRHRSRTRPVPGNHEYQVPGASAYFNYFGSGAGSAGQGYYAYSVGPWRIMALNSEIPIGPGSAQLQWLRSELSVGNPRCTAAIFHRPLYSSGAHGDDFAMRDVWRVLYDSNVDLVLSAHDHHYERFAPMDHDGRLDSARGIREFVLGTGGALMRAPTRVRQNSETIGMSWGVLVLTLSIGGYTWEFLSVEGGSFSDSGFGQCH